MIEVKAKVKRLQERSNMVANDYRPVSESSYTLTLLPDTDDDPGFMKEQSLGDGQGRIP